VADNAIELDAVTKRFGNEEALRGVTFTAPVGSVLGVLGPNGAGKTTTINILSTLLRPSTGRAIVAGYDVVTQARQVRASIALTGQYAAVDELLTGRENLVLFARLRGLNRHQARERADELLETFSLTDAGNRRVSTYSGGMRRRVDIACGLVVPPKVVFLDEPTTGLDRRLPRLASAVLQGATDVAGHRGDAGAGRRRSDAMARPAVGRVGGWPGGGVRPDGRAWLPDRGGIRQLTARRDST